MKLHPRLHWALGGLDIEPRVIELLRGIERDGSLRGAVAAARVSYRHAWGTLERIGNALGTPLVVRERGRGTRLTPFGEALLRATEDAEGKLRPQLETVEATWGPRLARAASSGATNLVLIHASHDLALARIRDRLHRSHRIRLVLQFRGSLECLAALGRGLCDLAGFHVPETDAGVALPEPLRPWLKARTLRIIPFARRQQGLMVAPGNPRRLKSLHDIVRRRARFVNRQPGSGTRLLFDHLLAAHAIRAAEIHGYQHEEFTHAAVAATVASGMADVGFGIEAAAREQRLDFVPVVWERYFLAAPASALNRPGPDQFLQLLRGGMLASVLGRLPGYRAPRALEPLTFREAFGPTGAAPIRSGKISSSRKQQEAVR